MAHDPFRLDGKLILVTGAGVGIGRGVALEAARRGADVVLHYSASAQGAHDAVAQIQAMGRRAAAIQADLSAVAECRRVVDEAVAFLGGLDGLVNNAGITVTAGLSDVSEEQFDRIYALNVRSHFFCAQHAVPHMIERGREVRARYPDRPWAGGSIVGVASVHGLAGMPGHSAYAGSKGALIAFCRALAVELCPSQIRVNAVAPGSIEVPSYWQTNPHYSRALGDSLVPWGRVGLPHDVGYLVAYLLSDAAEFMTGSVLAFDGGLTASMALPVQPPAGER